MEIILTKEQVKTYLGETRFMGAIVKDKYAQNEATGGFGKVVGMYTIEYTIGAPELGKSIEVKLDSDTQAVNIKPYAVVELVNLAYQPRAIARTFDGNARGAIEDRFKCDSIRVVDPSDVLADENGEKVESKPKVTNK